MGLKGVDYKVAIEKSREAKKRNAEAVTIKGRATDRRKPGEVRSPKDAITSFCSECITMYGLDVGGTGSVLNAIKACDCQECHLWPWRTGKLEVE